MGFADPFDVDPSRSGREGAMVPKGTGPVANLQRLLFENFDTETCAPLIRSGGASGWMEVSVSRLSRLSGVAMLAIAYVGAAYLATGLI